MFVLFQNCGIVYTATLKIYDCSIIWEGKPNGSLNACQTGMQGVSLTGVQSWATRFLDSGVSSFIGTLWSVRDITAKNFVEELYNQLTTGQVPIDEAVKNARIKCKEDGDPSWLAFELFAPPNLSIKLGSK
ncbi:MAG: CHAT domain-containing protein [Candidatus Nitrosocosmicus sp.]|nr:CHAT domain-containing protein [Candidatus Nitrosocosmicus sp.]